jgi:hypothetical protein
VFTLLNGFRSFRQWSPWARLDPQAEFLLTGPPQGVGARIGWIGDPARLGSGWQEIIASDPYERVLTRLELGTQGVAESEYRISGDALGSRVTWSYRVDVTEGQGWFGGWLGRYFGLFLDDWVAVDFEQGLAAFKSYAESLPGADFSGASIERLQVETLPVLEVDPLPAAAENEPRDPLSAAFGDIARVLALSGRSAAGPPMAVTRCEADGSCRRTVAVPTGPVLEGEPWSLNASARVRQGRSPGGTAVRLVHRGDPVGLPESYTRLEAWLAAHGERGTGVTWEVYVDDPRTTPVDQLETHVYAGLAASD